MCGGEGGGGEERRDHRSFGSIGAIRRNKRAYFSTLRYGLGHSESESESVHGWNMYASVSMCVCVYV